MFNNIYQQAQQNKVLVSTEKTINPNGGFDVVQKYTAKVSWVEKQHIDPERVVAKAQADLALVEDLQKNAVSIEASDYKNKEEK